MSRAAHVARGVAWSAVDAIRAESARLGIPTLFRTDLDHDERAILARTGHDDAGRSFGWAVHAHGTHYAHAVGGPTISTGRGRADASHRYMRAVAEAFAGTEIYWYLYTPRTGLIRVATAADLDAELAQIASDAARACEVTS